jgi:hypothetical protein
MTRHVVVIVYDVPVRLDRRSRNWAQGQAARTAVPTIGPKPAQPSRLRRAWRWMRATG